MRDSVSPPPTDRRLEITVCGVVQGVGFRPFVYRAARTHGLSGWVRNESDTVRISVRGSGDSLDAFLQTLRHRHPPQARVESVEVKQIVCEGGQSALTFQVLHSREGAAPRPAIPADLATCAECVAEVCDPAERRHSYPFTNCTNCGPRWSIIERLPYDRRRTSMSEFAMCRDCRAEYEDPEDRRFHAQPIACPACGPALRLLDSDGQETVAGDEALAAAAAAVRQGQIVALKGLGGFQLLADATNTHAVSRLRQRKQRPDRPFAVMLPSPAAVRSYCDASDQEIAALTSHEAPILLLTRRPEKERGSREQAAHDEIETALRPISGWASENRIAEAVAPGNPYLGVMLPYTPLHHLLMAEIGGPTICTSGNLSEEPMVITTEDAVARLGSIADVILTHNRPIVRPVDDSVARLGRDGLEIYRRARGYAPLPIALGFQTSPLLALGGHLKNTVALGLGHQIVLSPHIGDLDSVLSVEAHRQAARDLVGFFEVTPQMVVCDLHPDYSSTTHAESLAAGWKVPLLRVQHHQAHVAACVVEHGLEGPVLGFSWDGTGYGPDGTVWGGEVLECEGAHFTRVAHLRTFGLPGGDRAVREPRRSALGLLFEIFGEDASEFLGGLFRSAELKTLMSLLSRSVRTPRASSMGRLFDAVAALCGLPPVISFEGQAAMALEFAAFSEMKESYPLPLRDGQPAIADWEPLIRAVLADRRAGELIGCISARFHNALAELAVTVAQRHLTFGQTSLGRSGSGSRERAGADRIPESAKVPVVLTGGCFQNVLLARAVRTRLREAGFDVYTHRQVPAGDGGVAVGQVFVAAKQLKG